MPFGSAKSGNILPHKYGLPISAAGLAALSQLHPEEAQAAQRKPLRVELNAGGT